MRVTRCPIYLPDRLGGHAVWKLLALVIIVLDLFIAGYGFNPAADPAWLDFTPPAVQFLKDRQAEDPFFRVTTYVAPGEKTFNANGPWLFDIEDVRGYGSIISKQTMDYMSMLSNQYESLYNRIAPISTDQWWTLDSPLLDLLNVRYVATTQTITSTRYRLAYDGEMRIYENTGSMPRAFTLPDKSALYTESVSQTIQNYDPRYYVILDDPAAKEIASVAAQPRNDIMRGAPKPASISRYTHNEVFVDVNLDAPGWLILTDSYFPGWRAYVRPFGGQESDEQDVPIFRHAGNFRAVHLPAGQHTVRFKYTPTSVKVGLFLTFLGIMILALMLAIWAWRRFVSQGGERGDAHRVAKNSVAPIVLQLFNKAIDTAFMMLALRILTPQGAGQYYFIVNIVTYTDIFINFGLNIWLQREVAKALRLSSPPEQGNRYLCNAILFRLGLCLAAAPLLALFVLGWNALVEPLDAWQLWALTLFAIGLVPANVAAALTALFQAHEKMEHPAAVTVVSTIVKAGLGTLTLLLGWGIVGLGGVSVVTNLVTVAILGFWTVRMFFRPRFALDIRLHGQMLRESWPLMVNNLLSMGFFKADVLLLKAMQGDIVLGLYSSVAYKLIDAINIIPASFTFALFPLMSRYAASSQDGSPEALYRAYTLAVRLLVLISLPLALVLTTLAYPLSNLIGGSGYMPDSAIALQLMIWSIPLGFINSITHYVLIAQGRQHPLMFTFMIGLSFNIIANAICIPIWSYRSSAIIHILSELVLLAAFYVLMRRDLPLQPGLRPVHWLKLLWRLLLAGAAMGAVGRALYRVNVWLATAAALGVFVAAAWALGIFRDPEVALVRQLASRKGSQ